MNQECILFFQNFEYRANGKFDKTTKQNIHKKLFTNIYKINKKKNIQLSNYTQHTVASYLRSIRLVHPALLQHTPYFQ